MIIIIMLLNTVAALQEEEQSGQACRLSEQEMIKKEGRLRRRKHAETRSKRSREKWKIKNRECTAGRDCNSLCVIQRRNDLETL